MHNRRFASLLLGGWMGCTMFMWLVAIQNFSAVTRVIAAPSPKAAEIIQVLGEERAKGLLRYQVAEQNRWYFETWEYMQLVFSIIVFLTLIFARPRVMAAIVISCLIMISLLTERFLLTPQITALGRTMDFMKEGVETAESARFWIYHHTYSAVEMFKLCLGAILAVRFLMVSEDEIARRSKRSRKPTTAMWMGE
jgi:hypothetical protein